MQFAWTGDDFGEEDFDGERLEASSIDVVPLDFIFPCHGTAQVATYRNNIVTDVFIVSAGFTAV